MSDIKQETKTDKIEGKVLGQRVNAPQSYCPDILVRVPRDENRLQYGIEEDDLPFSGFDVWNAYEISCLTKKGYPVFLCAKIIYPIDNKYIVESKSLKLYLNSYNMEKMGDDYKSAKDNMTAQVRRDLSKLLECPIDVWFYNGTEDVVNNVYETFDSIEDMIDIDQIEFEDYNENKELLKIGDEYHHIKVKFPMLRSNCKITHQPDWGTAFVQIIAEKNVDVKSICKYIVSFRNENHFHEECVEMIYKRLFDLLSEHNESFKLNVSANYCRRGGIDICPIRVNDPTLADYSMVIPQAICKKLINQ